MLIVEIHIKVYKKIIFLDFDGVLNTEHYQGLLQLLTLKSIINYGTI